MRSARRTVISSRRAERALQARKVVVELLLQLRLDHRGDQPRLERRGVAIDDPGHLRSLGGIRHRVLVRGLEAGALEAQDGAPRGVELGDVQLEAEVLAGDGEVLADPGSDPQRRRVERLVDVEPGHPPRHLVDLEQPGEHRGRQLGEDDGGLAAHQPPAGFGPRRWRSGTTSAGGGVPSAAASRRSSSATRAESDLTASAIGSGRCAQSASGPSGRMPSTRTGCPGTPTTVEFGGTSWMTTEFAPILAPWPIVIGPSSFAPEPIVTLSSIVGWRLPVAKPAPPSVTPW